MIDNAYISGHFAYKNITIMQHKNIIGYIKKLLYKTQPSRVIEIGTAYGGFTLLLRDMLNEHNMDKVHLTTYDIKSTISATSTFEKINNITYIVKNIFEIQNNGTKYILKCEDIKNNIQNDGRTILFVDGGNKKAEFNCLAEYIKPNDIILAHDYIKSKDIFLRDFKDKIWNWCEITEQDIEDSCKTYGLQPYMQEDMEKVVWGCKTKIGQ